MFQNFNDDEGGGGVDKLTELRARMTDLGIEAFLVPREDAFLGEYVPACGERLKWLTGFGGSAGLAMILQDKAAILVDGRYVLQALQQVDTDYFEILPSMHIKAQDWLKDNLTAGCCVGFDPMLHHLNQIETLKKNLALSDIDMRPIEENPIDTIWADRPAPPSGNISVYPEKLAGASSREKRTQIAEKIKEQNADCFILTQPESIAWLLNIRGQDVPHTPLVLSYGVLHQDTKFDWFIDPARIDKALKKHLGDGINLIAPEKMATQLSQYNKKTVLLDPNTANYGFAELVPHYQKSDDLCALPKACKTKSELAATTAAHIRDGAALCEFLCWFDAQATNGNLSEISAAKQLEQFRAHSDALLDLSFDTISGTGPNGAIVHYRVTEKTNRDIKAGDLYLVDSGGQYIDGTTDVTRTIYVEGKPPPADAVMAFTRVLKGHIALATARFPAGTDGVMLDALARAPLWAAGLDFDHGTGHGVGVYLSVHEGPQRISKGGTVALKEGMIVSNEPGYYRTDAFGIRIENLQYVTAAEKRAGEERPMHGFHVLTQAPIDKRLIDKTLLTAEEISWLNDYHLEVRRLIMPLLSISAAEWLEQATEAL